MNDSLHTAQPVHLMGNVTPFTSDVSVAPQIVSAGNPLNPWRKIVNENPQSYPPGGTPVELYDGAICIGYRGVDIGFPIINTNFVTLVPVYGARTGFTHWRQYLPTNPPQ